MRERGANAFHAKYLRCALACAVLGSVAFAAAPDEPQATIRGRAASVAGKPVAGVKVTFVEQLADAKGRTWTATSSPNGTFTLTMPVPAHRTVYPKVEAPPGGKLAPCAVLPQQALRLEPGATVELTVLLAPATARLVGTVTDAAGHPVKGATVALGMGSQRGPISQSATTDAKGRYRAGPVAPGGYVVTAVDPPEGSSLIRLNTWRPHGVRQVSLADGQTATEDFQLPRGTRLAGRVVDERGKPLGGAAVSCRLDVATEVGQRSVYQRIGQWYRGEAATDAEGRYSLGGVTLETYQIEVRPPDGHDLAPAVLHDVNAREDGGDVKVQDIRLYKAAALVGTVVGADAKPVEGAEAVVRVGWGRHGTMLTVSTGGDGRFTLRGLATGAYAVTVRPSSGSPWCEKQFERVTVVGGLTVERRFELARGAEVRGTVTAPDGRPVAGASVMARYGYHPRGKATTDERGRFALLGVSPPPQPGPRRRGGPQNQVVVSPTGDWPTLVQGTAPLPDVALGETATVNVPMTEGVAIEGRVTGPDGKPVVGCRVGASQRRRGSQLGYSSGVTDAKGRYLLPHLPVGDLFVSATPPAGSGLLPTESPQHRYEPGKATVDVAMKRGAAVVGKVVTSRGKPVVGVSVRLQSSSGGRAQAAGSAVSGVGGVFRIQPVAPGSYQLQSSPSDPTLRGKAATLTVAGTGEHKAEAVVYKAASVAGAVRDGKGEPIGHGFLWLSVYSGQGKARQQHGTAHPKEGTWRVGGLPPGRYAVVVTIGPRGRQMGMAAPEPIEFTIKEGQEAKLDVTVPFGAAAKGPKRTDF